MSEEDINEKIEGLILSVKINKEVIGKTKHWNYKDKTTLNIVIVNLLSFGSKIKYSRDTAHYVTPKKYNPKKVSRYQIINVMNYLIEQNLVDYYIAPRQFNTSNKIKEVSWVKANNNLLSLFEDKVKEDCRATVIKDRQCVLLKDEDGEIIDYKDNAVAYDTRDKLSSYNTFASEVVVMLDGERMTTTLDAQFKHDFNSYGRLYGKGNTYQTIKSVYRPNITINGEDVIEIDYSCLHLRMLLDMFNLSYYVEGIADLYSLVSDNKEDRDVIKLAINIYFNAKNRNGAVVALAQEVFCNPHPFSFTKASEVFDAIDKAYYFLFGNKAIIDNLRNGNKRIAAVLQRKDSELCLDIITQLADKNIFVGAVHDSFFFATKHFDLVSEVIGNTYRKHMKTNRPVDVSVSYKNDEWKTQI